jgi:hypothetical protein
MSQAEDLTIENIEIDSHVSSIPIYQCKGALFHQKCLSFNSSEIDSTGLRMHGGTHVGLRFLQRYLLDNTHIFPPGRFIFMLSHS